MTGPAHIQQPFAVGGDTTVQMRDLLQAAGQHRRCLRLRSCDRELHKFLRAVSVSKEVQHTGQWRRAHGADRCPVGVEAPEVSAFRRDRRHAGGALVVPREHQDAIGRRIPLQPSRNREPCSRTCLVPVPSNALRLKPAKLCVPCASCEPSGETATRAP